MTHPFTRPNETSRRAATGICQRVGSRGVTQYYAGNHVLLLPDICDGREYERDRADDARGATKPHRSLCDAVSIHRAGHRDLGLHLSKRSFRG